MYSLRTLATRRTPIASLAIAQRAGMHQSIARLAGKETALHTEGRAEDIEKEKQDSLNKQRDGKGQWKDGLASDSESIVKADRNESGTSTAETIKKLQEEGKKVGQQ